ncbi:MAG: glycosyltransferase [bacterium]|nr:glycosyltransferase [bacterium]
MTTLATDNTRLRDVSNRVKRTGKLKVAIVVNDLLRGGAQRIILDIVRNAPSHFEFVVIAMKADDVFTEHATSTLRKDVEEAGARVFNISHTRRFKLGDVWKLRALLRSERPDIVHTFLPHAGTLGRIAARMAGVRAIVTTQCNVRVAYDFWRYWIDRLTLILAHAWTGSTEGIELEYGGSIAYFSNAEWRRGRRHFTIPSGADLNAITASRAHLDREKKRKELGLPADGVMILMTARLIRWKGHTDLVRALVHLPPSVHVFCAGWGPLHEELLRLAQDLGVSNRYHLLGSRQDTHELLGATDVYVQVHSTASDGRIWMGPNISQTEACAAGVPSVSTRVPLIEYLIEDGITGKLAEPNNPRSLAAAITWVIDHPKEARTMAKAAQERVRERYTVEHMVSQYADMYLSL